MRVVTDWFGNRSPREQRMLLVMLAILVPLLIYLLLVAPLSAAYRSALEEHLEAIDRNGRVKALAEGSTNAPAAQFPQVSDLSLYLTDNGRQRGIEASARGNAGQARVTVAGATPAALLAWLSGLESAGLALDDVRIAPAGDGSVSASFTTRVATQ